MDNLSTVIIMSRDKHHHSQLRDRVYEVFLVGLTRSVLTDTQEVDYCYLYSNQC
jgi:hypothetical protein